MSDVVIKAEGLGKKYVIGHQAENGRYVALRDVLTHNVRSMWHKTKDLFRGDVQVQGDSREDFWALRDVSFEIRQAEVVGVIGRNGAGKSTLLKILSRITEPTTGAVKIKGRVASLLEVGTGFHPELTGRENILLNGAILGMSRAEVKKKFDEIVSFADVEKFLDTPVKRYSSGMYVRLAFAIAAHLEPDILVVDEVLAVGDADFQRKCLGKMQDVSTGGRTVLFVSHNMATMRLLCSRGLLFQKGELICSSKMDDVVNLYEQSRPQADLQSDNDCFKVRVSISRQEVYRGEPVILQTVFSFKSGYEVQEAAILLYNAAGLRVGVMDLRHILLSSTGNGSESLTIETVCDTFSLVEDLYRIGIYVMAGNRKFDYHNIEELLIREPVSRTILPYPRHVRGFVELKAQSTIIEAQCTELSNVV